MIGFLKGQVLAIDSDTGHLLLGVGSEVSGMVGYRVRIPHSPAYLKHVTDQAISLHIYSHVREDQFDLYGFSTPLEKELFLLLISVSGVGPRAAMATLSHSSSDALIRAIIDGDKAFLNQIPGIGKKTAERLVLELSESLRKKVESDLRFGSLPTAAAGTEKGADFSRVEEEALEALSGLGYQVQEARRRLTQISREGPVRSVEDAVRRALQV